MSKKSKFQPLPLETINQNPGNQESFADYSDSTQTMPQNYEQQSHSYPIQSKISSKSLDASSQEQEIRPEENKEKKKKKKTKSENDPERPKINMPEKALKQDLKLLQEQHEIATIKILSELKELKTPKQHIELILEIINESHKRTLDKITKNIRILPAIYSEEIAPVEISLTNQTKKINDLTEQNLRLAESRIKAEKATKKHIKIFPRVPKESDIIFEDGSAMTEEKYYKEKTDDTQIKKAEEAVKDLEQHLSLMQRNFIETVELHRITNKDLEEDLNGMRQSEKSVKKKRESHR